MNPVQTNDGQSREDREKNLETALSVIETALLWGQPSFDLRAELLEERERLQRMRQNVQESQRLLRIHEEFKRLDEKIRQAVDESDWATLLDESFRFATDPMLQKSSRYLELKIWLNAQYSDYLENDNFAAAGHLRVALRNVDPDGGRERETQWQTRQEAVEAERLRLQNEIEDRRKEKSELDSQLDREGRVQEFQQWALERQLAWQALASASQPNYGELVTQADETLKKARQDYGKIAQEPIFQQWKEWVRKQKSAWEQQERAADDLDAALEALGALTAESLKEAKTKLEEAKNELDSSPSAGNQILSQRLKQLRELRDHVENYVLPAKGDLEKKLNNLKNFPRVPESDHQAVESALRDVLHAAAVASRYAQAGHWQRELGVQASVFPALDDLLEEATNWSVLLPLSGEREIPLTSGAGSLRLSKEDLERIVDAVDRKIDERLQSLIPAPTVESPSSDLPEPFHVPKWSVVLVGVVGVVAILVVVGLLVRGPWSEPAARMFERVARVVPSAPTSTPTVTATPIDTGDTVVGSTSATPPSLTPTRTPTSTPTPTQTPMPLPGMSMSWAEDVPLFDMPPLTLTASSGTRFVSETAGAALRVQVAQVTWTVSLVVDDQEQHGVFTFTNDSLVLWGPDPEGAPLEAGSHDIQLRVSADGQKEELPSLPIEIAEALSLVSADGQVRPQPENDSSMNTSGIVDIGYNLEAIGWLENGSVTFAQVRVPGSRKIWWVNISGSGGSAYATLEDGENATSIVKESLPEVSAPK